MGRYECLGEDMFKWSRYLVTMVIAGSIAPSVYGQSIYGYGMQPGMAQCQQPYETASQIAAGSDTAAEQRQIIDRISDEVKRAEKIEKKIGWFIGKQQRQF